MSVVVLSSVASPAMILQAILVENQDLPIIMPAPLAPGIIQSPQDGTTQCFVSSMPDDIDQCVGIWDVTGLVFGRAMPTGQTWGHNGLKLNIRSLYYRDGYTLANAIAQEIDQLSSQFTIVIGGTTHYISNVYRTSLVTALGEEVGKRRQLFSLSARLVLQDREPTLG